MTQLLSAFPVPFISRGAETARAWEFQAAGGAALAGWVVLAAAAQQGEAVPLALYLAVMAVAWAATLVARREAGRVSPGMIWMWALLFRVAGMAAAPVLEDDFYRYLWDGRVFSVTGDPYGKAPMEWFADTALPTLEQQLLSQINHPDLPTVYGPVSEWAFRLSYEIAPYRLWPWKAMLLAADLGMLALLLPRLTKANAVLLAWCPLLIFETGFNVHPETLGVLFLVGALVLLERRQAMAAGVCLAAAAGVKATGAVLAPLLFVAGGWATAGAFVAGLAVLYLPFSVTSGVGALGVFAKGWEFNASVYSLIAAVGGNGAAAGAAAAGMAGAVAVAIWRRVGIWTGGLWISGSFYFMAPVVNAWYLLWLLPFVAMAPDGSRAKRMGMMALGAASLSYICGIHLGWPGLGAYDHPWWVRPLEYGLVAAAGVWPIRPKNLLPEGR